MRHRKATSKLGMKSQHRRATLANLVRSLIIHKRIRTTIAKAKVARSLADKMVTLGKKNTLHTRRLAIAQLSARGPGAQTTPEERKRWRKEEDAITILFEQIAPSFKDRQGGYTRVIRIGNRVGDAAEMAILEWTSSISAAPAPATTDEAAKPKEDGETKEPAKPKRTRKSKEAGKSEPETKS